MISRITIKPGATLPRAVSFPSRRWAGRLCLVVLAALALSAVTAISACRNDQAIIDRHEKALSEDDE